MMRSAILCGLIACAACGPGSESFQVSMVLERDDAQQCPSDVCEGIPMGCNATMSIRIVDASDPSIAYYSDCVDVTGGTDLCALADLVELEDRAIPNTMVRVEIAVWPRDLVDALMLDDDQCPGVDWDEQGKAKTVFDDPLKPPPAIGGASYFEVGGSSVATVVLGCLDHTVLDHPSCSATGAVAVSAGVVDFDTNVSVSPTVQNLVVSVGEPTFDGSAWSLPIASTTLLDRDVVAGSPVWSGDLEEPFETAACIQVLETDVPLVLNTLACRPAGADDTVLELDGVLVRKATQDLVQDAIGGFPPGGFVLGRVVDHTGQPAEGVTVAPQPGGPTVAYLAEDMASLTTGAVTTTSGAFVSLNAPFDTTWTAQLDSRTEVEVQLGGLVAGKVTVIELQLTAP